MNLSRYQLIGRLLVLIILGMTLSRCTSVIDAKIAPGTPQLSVDAFLNDKPGPQTIRLTRTGAYFDSSAAPVATGATVQISDSDGHAYRFTDPDDDGYYVWQPKGSDTLARIGRNYQLSIEYQNETYKATTRMNRVPPIDSIVFHKDKSTKYAANQGYESEFYARDLAGATDFYRIIYYRNGLLQNTPEDLRAILDGAPDASANTDGLEFFTTIRKTANPTDFFNLGDLVTIEIQSIDANGFDFLKQLKKQLQSGGLFAIPSANLPTNIMNQTTTGHTATGLFSVSATRNRTVRVTEYTIRPGTD